MLKKKKNKIGIIIFYFLFILVLLKQIKYIINIRKDIKKMNIKVEEKETKIFGYKKKILNLKENLKNIEKLDTIEKIAREKLCMKKEGEIIYKELKEYKQK
ncbi:MAG: hypothetical protein B6I28_02825 [Fusobacteriia bacterium 4572_132]|nr:MAG: hypothetical protein B6I28_02825 [Fusobacteriia bacterium 4572_132]